jgi:hypothetical protein
MNRSRFRHTESGVYASATRSGSREFHASSAALAFNVAVSCVNGGLRMVGDIVTPIRCNNKLPAGGASTWRHADRQQTFHQFTARR